VTLLAELVATSQRVGAASARRTKVRELAAFLKTLTADEIETAVHYLSGEISQGRIGITYKALQAAVAGNEAANEHPLSIADVDRCLAAIADTRGTGSAARRAQALRALFSRATSAEQRFLVKLLAGELRQGALAGVMADAIAAAAELPVGRCSARVDVRKESR
jgi:DNA ligase-1